MARQDQYRNTVSVDGRPLGVFDTWSGGAGTSEELKYRKGGGGKQKSHGGPATTDNITVGRIFEGPEDQALIKWLYTRRGKGRFVANRQPLDVDGNPWGDSLTYTGVLMEVTPGDTDSNSADADVYELLLSTDEEVS